MSFLIVNKEIQNVGKAIDILYSLWYNYCVGDDIPQKRRKIMSTLIILVFCLSFSNIVLSVLLLHNPKGFCSKKEEHKQKNLYDHDRTLYYDELKKNGYYCKDGKLYRNGRVIKGESGQNVVRLTIRLNGKERNTFYHRVVYALAHKQDLLPNERIIHIDGNKCNNSISNLKLEEE